MPTSGSDSEPDQAPGFLNQLPSRLTFLAGKGGVGRSTVAAGLAYTAALDGQRVLAIDAIDDGGLEAALAGCPQPATLEVLRLTTEKSLEQYIDLFLPLPMSPRRIGPVARILDYVAVAAPGVREILTLGKIAWELREGPWDRIIVDAPATGHVIELLAAADTLGDLIGTGPLAAQTEWISALLADSRRSGVVVVTGPDELPVTETLELLGRLAAETRLSVTGLVANRVPTVVENSSESARLGDLMEPVGEAVRTALERSNLWVEQRQRLEATRLPLCSVGDAEDPLSIVGAEADLILGWA